MKMDTKEEQAFFSQINEDIKLIQKEFLPIDPKLNKKEYAFNYWVLSKLYSIDEEIIKSLVTEYNDKSVDCFVYYEENKELYIIQNKFYSESNSVSRNDVSDFLTTPLACLSNNNYKKSKELQDIYNKIAGDESAKINLHFYVTNNKEYNDIRKNVESFNITKDHNGIKANASAKFFTLSDIYDLYYGKQYKKNVQFNYDLKTINKGTFASLREEYDIDGICEAYYIITPIPEIYDMLNKAKDRGYPIFEENIREYLGKGSRTSINNGIINTLKDENERKNFLYYNNGITITCSNIESTKQEKNKRCLPLVNPQIVNGCQTVNSIVEVLSNYSQEEILQIFGQVYIMVKALIIPNIEKPENKTFANNVVKYTNRQNAVSDKAFASDNNLFYRFQEEFKTRGFILLVKPSDKNKFKNIDTTQLLNKAKEYSSHMGYNLEKVSDLYIPLEKLLQVYLALKKDGYMAFVKKSTVLQKDSATYNDFSTRIQETLTIDDMIKLYLLYKRAESDRAKSEDKRTPIPYYLIGFLSKFLQEQNVSYSKFFNSSIDKINEVYTYLIGITKSYRNEYYKRKNIEYNMMIKQPIDISILNEVIENGKIFGSNFPAIDN